MTTVRLASAVDGGGGVPSPQDRHRRESSNRRCAMRSRIVTVILGALVTLAVVVAPAVAGNAPNQGDPDKVIKVDNPNVWCADPVPGKKIEGGLGQTIHVSASQKIDFVTIKSGQGAYVVYKTFDKYWGKIKLSKDVSNYVVWTCPKY
jgi:hypothetical protein